MFFSYFKKMKPFKSGKKKKKITFLTDLKANLFFFIKLA